MNAQSRDQHKAALWADDAVQVYAVLMGGRIPGLPAMLASADVSSFDCLLPGVLPGEVQRTAPYFARLKRSAAFTDWLLFEAAAAFGGWGALVRSASPFTPLRSHLRNLAKAQTPEGEVVPLAWMDPQVLDALLPLAGAEQAALFFGPLRSIVVAGAKAWTTYDGPPGPLVVRSVAVMEAG